MSRTRTGSGDGTLQVLFQKARRHGISGWSIGAVLIAALVVMPIAAVVWIALTPTENIWPHLMRTTLPRYLSNTVILMLAVGGLAAATGTITAWLTTMYRFPGVRLLSWALLLPLAIPAYIGAYALTDLFEYAGPVQSGLRSLFGWANARDYWFPEVRSRGVAIIVLAAALYPYVYLLTRSALREQSACSFEVARSLGAGPYRRFFGIGIPLARPAIAAGTAIVMMETVSDFGVVEFFAVQTLTTGIFSTWLQAGNAGGAAQIALVVLSLVFLLAVLEKFSRRKIKVFGMSRQQRPLEPIQLHGWRAWLATATCTLPFVIGFAVPAGVIAVLALRNAEGWLDPDLVSALMNTLLVAGSAAVLTVSAALFMVYGVRLTGGGLPKALMPVTTLGYAAPGAVLGLGLLLPMAAADHWIADQIEARFGWDVGLLMTGSAFAIIVAYAVRFFAIAQGATDSALGRISPSLPLAARSLGRSAGGTLRHVHLPLIRGSIGTALLLVFVDAVKELPATLLLRPFNFDTLSTRVYNQASLERIGDAAPPAMVVILLGLCVVLILIRSNR